jgi:GT2 family glycosyltransferase
MAYNEAMDSSTAEWVLLLDWDLFNCNPYWYDMCVSAIQQCGDRAGWITCVTNRIGSNSQKAKFFMPEDDPPPMGHNLSEHMLYGRRLHRKYNALDDTGQLVKAKVQRFKGALSGFFILTSKTAWKAAGGFDEKRKRLMGVDNIYSRDICRAGYQLWGMPGLYFYHIYREKTRLWRGNPK